MGALATTRTLIVVYQCSGRVNQCSQWVKLLCMFRILVIATNGFRSYLKLNTVGLYQQSLAQIKNILYVQFL